MEPIFSALIHFIYHSHNAHFLHIFTYFYLFETLSNAIFMLCIDFCRRKFHIFYSPFESGI